MTVRGILFSILLGALWAFGASARDQAPVSAPGASAAPTMKAVRIHSFGKPDVLVYEDALRPTPGPVEALVRIHAAGVNPVDWKIRSGTFKGMNLPMPFILGFDISGVVESVGADVKGFKPGDEVFAYMSLRRGGGYAEYAAVPESELAVRPKSIDHVLSAGVPLAALTAWQALFDTAGLKEGQTVLIHGGAGGVGHFAVQLAKSRGAKVIATASAPNHDFLKSIGADQAIDYRTQKFEEHAKDVDVVLDTVGGDTLARSYQVLKPGGYLVSIVQPPDPEMLAEREIKGRVILVQPNGKDLSEIAALIDAGKVKPHVSETVPLQDVAHAHIQSQGGHTRGKIVLKVR